MSNSWLSLELPTLALPRHIIDAELARKPGAAVRATEPLDGMLQL